MSDNDYYYLMHLNSKCSILEFDMMNGYILDCDVIDKALMPMNGRADIKNLRNWWRYRPVPSTREDMKMVMRLAGAEFPEVYLIKNLGLSMTDTYWICPIDKELRWEDVCLVNQKEIGKSKVPYHNIDSYDPNASLGGQMSKHWDITKEPPVLVKDAYKYFGQQAVNEQFATLLHSRQPKAPEYVKYIAERDSNSHGLTVSCKTFVDPGLEFLPAYEIGAVKGNELSEYDKHIKAWVDCGMDESVVREYFDYQTLTDFIISNVDRHLANFGAIRQADTLEFVKPAPIFDSGNSMFYTESEFDRKLSKPELLNRNIVSIYDKEEKMMARVQNRGIVDLDALPTKEETMELYTSFGVPEAKVEFIVDAYLKKIEITHEFQKGQSISFFNEKKMKYRKPSIRFYSSSDNLDDDPDPETENHPDIDDDIEP